MPQATSISLSKFTTSVQAAVKAAVARHPKFNIEPPHAVTVAYLIRGFPVPDELLKAVTVSETQAFANEVAGALANAHSQIFDAAGGAGRAQGAFTSVGGHVIIGIPPVLQPIQLEK